MYQKTLARLDASTTSSSSTSVVGGGSALNVSMLVAEFHLGIQTLVSRGIKLSWDYFINTYHVRSGLLAAAAENNRHIAFVRDLSKLVSESQEKTMVVLQAHDEIVKLYIKSSNHQVRSYSLIFTTSNHQVLAHQIIKSSSTLVLAHLYQKHANFSPISRFSPRIIRIHFCLFAYTILFAYLCETCRGTGRRLSCNQLLNST